ncbi:MAG TPA: B12-binding domain-containing radical SAM protein [Planctomycetota bacterium]|nr:B12-binding domain-containing radical SAM protein [Planctomycetota bacterium]
MRIYLADLYHVYQAGRNPDTNPYTVPLGVAFLSSTLKIHEPGFEVRLFRDPNRLLAAVRSSPPDVMGFTFSSWNSDLTDRISRAIKAEAPRVVTVGGGPSVDDTDDQLTEFFSLHPTIDFLVPGEGESGFLALARFIACGERRQGPIPGVAYLETGGRLVRGGYDRPIVPGAPQDQKPASEKGGRPSTGLDVQVPSPYLDGTLDPFLKEGLVPIIQTMRGCPYQCHFCVSGATEWNRLRGFDLDRVRAEIDRALSLSGSKDLILTDENWGLLGERDIEIARFLMERRRVKGSPQRLYYYTAKIVTPASRTIVEMVAPIAWIGEFSMSFQSMNPETRSSIKRTNITPDKLAANIQWARERGIQTSSEMIYGFPHETPETFFDGVERLLEEGIDKVSIYPLQLFPGIDLAARSARTGFGLETRFRLADGGFGVYDEGRIVSAESEEVVVANRWSDLDGYFRVRRYSFFQMAVLGREYFAEFSRLLGEAGVAMAPIIRHLAGTDFAPYPALAGIMAEHRREAERELKATREGVCQELQDRISRGQEMQGVKVNLVILGRILSSEPATREWLEIIREYFSRILEGRADREVILSYLTEVLPNRIVILQPGAKDRVRFSSRFDYSRWSSKEYRKISELLLPRPRDFEAVASEELRRNLSSFDATQRSHLQGIFDRTPSRQLLRSIAG